MVERCSGMKLIKLTELAASREIYINSNCILSCERLYLPELNDYYTSVGVLYENRFQFLRVKEPILEIQEQLRGA